jgi:hypothetical protein
MGLRQTLLPALWGQHMPVPKGAPMQKRQGVCRKRQCATSRPLARRLAMRDSLDNDISDRFMNISSGSYRLVGG